MAVRQPDGRDGRTGKKQKRRRPWDDAVRELFLVGRLRLLASEQTATLRLAFGCRLFHSVLLVAVIPNAMPVPTVLEFV